MVSLMMSSSTPSLAYFSRSWSAIGLSSVSAASRSVFDFRYEFDGIFNLLAWHFHYHREIRPLHGDVSLAAFFLFERPCERPSEEYAGDGDAGFEFSAGLQMYGHTVQWMHLCR